MRFNEIETKEELNKTVLNKMEEMKCSRKDNWQILAVYYGEELFSPIMAQWMLKAYERREELIKEKKYRHSTLGGYIKERFD